MQARLVGWYLLVSLGILAAMYLLAIWTGMASGATNAFTAILVAVVPGEVFHRRTNALPSAAFSWRMAALFAVANAAVSIMSLIILVPDWPLVLLSPYFWVPFVVLSMVSLVGMRFTFAWGAKLRQRKVQNQSGANRAGPSS